MIRPTVFMWDKSRSECGKIRVENKALTIILSWKFGLCPTKEKFKRRHTGFAVADSVPHFGEEASMPETKA